MVVHQAGAVGLGDKVQRDFKMHNTDMRDMLLVGNSGSQVLNLAAVHQAGAVHLP